MLKIVFNKLKEYYKYRACKIRAKVRANVFLRIKRSERVIRVLKEYKNIENQRKINSEKSQRRYKLRLKDKALAGFIKNLIRRSDKRKSVIKAACFYKNMYLYKSIFSWKNLKFELSRRDHRKRIITEHNAKRIKQKYFKILDDAREIIRKDSDIKHDLFNKTK